MWKFVFFLFCHAATGGCETVDRRNTDTPSIRSASSTKPQSISNTTAAALGEELPTGLITLPPATEITTREDCTLQDDKDCHPWDDFLLDMLDNVNKERLQQVLAGNGTGDFELRQELLGQALERQLLFSPQSGTAEASTQTLSDSLKYTSTEVAERSTQSGTQEQLDMPLGLSRLLTVPEFGTSTPNADLIIRDLLRAWELNGTLFEKASSMDVTNLTQGEAKEMFTAVRDLLVKANSTKLEDKDKAAQLLFQLSRFPSIDQDMLIVYAESTSLVIYGEASEPDEKKNVKETVAKGIVESMERVMTTTSVSFYQQELDQLVLSIHPVTANKADSNIQLSMKFNGKKNAVSLCPALFQAQQGRVSTVIYGDLHYLLPSNKKGSLKGGVLASHVMSIVVQASDDHGRYSEPVANGSPADSVINFTLPYLHSRDSKIGATRWCVFWEFLQEAWSEDGCWILKQNRTHTSCTCNHLSTFAVLVTFTKTKVSPNNAEAMFILTAIGCTLSIASLALTLFTYLYLRILHRERIMIHANLATSLLLAQVLFVSSEDAHKNETACKVVAVLLHFLFMASFSWMFVEGVVLYRTCTSGLFYTCDTRAKHMVMGWGLPLVVVLVSLGIEFPSYGHGLENSCWLSAEHGLIWAFLAPMLVVVSLNVLILVLVIRVFLTLRANSQKSEAARVRAGLRAMVMLLPLLGTTWLLSLLVPLSSVFSYLFILFNSLQGLMIFLLHCLCNEEVRRFLAKKRSCRKSRTPTSETNVSVVWRRRYPECARESMKRRCQSLTFVEFRKLFAKWLADPYDRDGDRGEDPVQCVLRK